MKRREFIKRAAVGTTAAMVMPQLVSCNRKEKVNRETLRDRLWMWGHEPYSISGIPQGGNMEIVEAIKWMGIPNVCVINHGDVIKLPYEDEYIKMYKDVDKVAWSIMSGPEWSPEFDKVRKYSHNQLIEEGFKLIDKMPNLTELYLDDFFAGDGVDEANGLSNANMSLERLKKLKAEAQSLKRQPQLTAVLYASQINSGIKAYMDYFDRVSLWTWDANDLTKLEENFRKYKKLPPNKPTLLGIYMWDFANFTTISLEQMKMQLDFAYKILKAGEVEELIFHCTPLCDMNLEAVHYSRQWIASHGDEII